MANLINGFPFDSGDFADDSDVALVRIRDILASDFETYVPASKVPRSVMIRDGDVVIGMDGDFNSVYWQRGAAALNQRLCLLRANAAADARYLAYTLPTELAKINEVTYSTTVKHLSSEQVRRIKLWAPDVQGQARIADFLDRDTAKIDALIDKQGALISALGERRVAAIESVLLSKGAPSALGHFVSALPGYAFDSDGFSANPDGGVRLLRGVNVKPGSTDWAEVVHWPADALQGLGAYLLKPNDVVLGLDRPFIAGGTRVALIQGSDLPCLLLQRVLRLRARQNMDPRYLALLLMTRAFQEYATPEFTGVSVPHLSDKQVRSFSARIPVLEVQRSMAEAVYGTIAGIDALIGKAQRTIELAQERRAALITAAVTGRLDISTGEVA